MPLSTIFSFLNCFASTHDSHTTSLPPSYPRSKSRQSTTTHSNSSTRSTTHRQYTYTHSLPSPSKHHSKHHPKPPPTSSSSSTSTSRSRRHTSKPHGTTSDKHKHKNKPLPPYPPPSPSLCSHSYVATPQFLALPRPKPPSSAAGCTCGGLHSSPYSRREEVGKDGEGEEGSCVCGSRASVANRMSHLDLEFDGLFEGLNIEKESTVGGKKGGIEAGWVARFGVGSGGGHEGEKGRV